MQAYLFNDDWFFTNSDDLRARFHGECEPPIAVTLPYDAMIRKPRSPQIHHGNLNGYFPDGTYVYSKTCFFPSKAQQHFVLEFDGIFANAMIYINDYFAGKCPYGYSSFYLEIDKYLKYGEKNTIKVVARSHADSRRYSGGGIYRDVYLHVGGPLCIEPNSIRVDTCSLEPDLAVIGVSTRISNREPGFKDTLISARVTDSGGRIVAEDTMPASLFSQTSNKFYQKLYVKNPRPWSIEDPHLYTMEIHLIHDHKIIDRASTTFGIRTISLDPVHGLRINGQRVILHGGCIHHDNGIIGANEYAACAERRIRILKSCGFNAIRSAHSPASPAILDACDRLGMLVLDEIFDMWNYEKTDFDYSLSFSEYHMEDLGRMIAKDYNHPSVFMYSIGNEIVETGDGGGAATSREMADFIRREDPSRPITNAIDGIYSVRPFLFSYAKDHGLTIDTIIQLIKDEQINLASDPIIAKKTAEAFASVDVAGYSYLSSRYLIDHDSYPTRIIMGTENQPIELAIGAQLAQENPWFLGQFVYTAWDYLGDAGKGRIDYSPSAVPGNRGTYPWYIAYNGDVDITGNRRPASYYHEILFDHRTNPFIAVQHPKNHGVPSVTTPWTWNDYLDSWTFEGWEGKATNVEVYTKADTVQLFLNGKPVGTASAGAKNKYIARFEIEYAPGTLKAIAVQDGVVVGESELSTAASNTILNVKPSKSHLFNDPSDLVFLDIALTDNFGVLKPALEDSVSLKVTGPAHILGFGSADPKSTENFFDSTRTTFNGRLQAILCPTGDTGTVSIRIKSKKHGSQTLELPVEGHTRAKNPLFT